MNLLRIWCSLKHIQLINLKKIRFIFHLKLRLVVWHWYNRCDILNQVERRESRADNPGRYFLGSLDEIQRNGVYNRQEFKCFHSKLDKFPDLQVCCNGKQFVPVFLFHVNISHTCNPQSRFPIEVSSARARSSYFQRIGLSGRGRGGGCYR